MTNNTQNIKTNNAIFEPIIFKKIGYRIIDYIWDIH
jgi:hypothetical protein